MLQITKFMSAHAIILLLATGTIPPALALSPTLVGSARIMGPGAALVASLFAHVQAIEVPVDVAELLEDSNLKVRAFSDQEGARVKRSPILLEERSFIECGDKDCSNEVCVPNHEDGPQGCTSCVNNVCYRLEEDAAHCGAVDHRCTPFSSCKDSKCVCNTDYFLNSNGKCQNQNNNNCGVPTLDCSEEVCDHHADSPKDKCINCVSGVCYRLRDDEKNCGSVNNVCTPNSSCRNSECVCGKRFYLADDGQCLPETPENCGTPRKDCTATDASATCHAGECYSFESDPLNCGGVGTVCTKHSSCVDSSCVCDPGHYRNTNGQCKPWNARNCGDPWVDCTVTNCVAGLEGKQSGNCQTCEQGTCRNLQRDPLNCGSVGAECALPKLCAKGNCTLAVCEDGFKLNSQGKCTLCTTAENPFCLDCDPLSGLCNSCDSSDQAPSRYPDPTTGECKFCWELPGECTCNHIYQCMRNDDRSPVEADFQKLYDAIQTIIIETDSDSLIPEYVRASFHDLMQFDGTSFGAEGCIFDDPVRSFEANSDLENPMIELAKAISINAELSGVHITLGDVVSMAGKVAIEMSFPCVRPDWSGGRKMCDSSPSSNTGPPGSIDSRASLKPFLTRYGMTDQEMAVLTIGAHAVKKSHVAGLIYNGENSGTQFIAETVDVEWIFTQLGDDAGGNGDGFQDPTEKIGRLKSDMLFFPSVVTRVQGRTMEQINVDDSYAGLEGRLTNMNEVNFDSQFEAIYAKMLLIGTTGLGAKIANRPKGDQCMENWWNGE